MLDPSIHVDVGEVATSAPNETDLYPQIGAQPNSDNTLGVAKNVAPVIGFAHQSFGGADRIREYRLGYRRVCSGQCK